MTFAMMQPYFFPRLSYFQLIHASEEFVLFDSANLIIKGWVRRNRIYEPNRQEKWQYINVPLISKSQNGKILDARIDSEKDWNARVSNQLNAYKSFDYFEETMQLLNDSFSIKSDFLVDLLEHTIRLCSHHLGLNDSKIIRHSSLDVKTGPNAEPDSWALDTALALGHETYINPEGGRDLFSLEKYNDANVKLRFLRSTNDQLSSKDKIVSELSILDSLMRLGQEKVGEMLRNDYLIVD